MDGPSSPNLALLRVGFAEPPGSPRALVRSYRTVSPLPRPAGAGPRRSVFCGTFLRVTPTGRYPAPCPVESGRSSDRSPPDEGPARGRPADSPPCPLSRALLGRRWVVLVQQFRCPPGDRGAEQPEPGCEQRVREDRAQPEAEVRTAHDAREHADDEPHPE